MDKKNKPTLQQNVLDFLNLKLSEDSSEKSFDILQRKKQAIAKDFSTRGFYLAFSSLTRYFNSDLYPLTQQDIIDAKAIHPNWDINGFSKKDMAQLVIFLSLPTIDKDEYISIVSRLFYVGDIGELKLLYSNIFLFPFQEEFVSIATEGIRSNIKDVFEAIALNNIYPSLYFTEKQWNQMILKAIFNSSSISNIIGLSSRANITLSQQISDYAHERWAAGRNINPEIWQITSFAYTEQLLADYNKLLNSSDIFENNAGILVCMDTNNKYTDKLLKQYTELKEKILAKKYTWLQLSADCYEKLNKLTIKTKNQMVEDKHLKIKKALQKLNNK
jgi:hypothetical protein